MKSIYGTRMSLEDYHRMPRRLGWTYDYESGHAIVMPADVTVDVHLALAGRTGGGSFGSYRLCSVEEDKAFALLDLFVDAFRPTAESFGLDDDDLYADAQFAMMLYFSGACGEPMSCSRVVVDGNEPVAAMLVVAGEPGPSIRTLMVHPRCQRRGIARALLTEVTAWLEIHGFDELHSRYYLANEASRSWYRKMEFIERPDASAVRHWRHFCHYEVSRLREDPHADVAERNRVESELLKWSRLASEMRISM